MTTFCKAQEGETSAPEYFEKSQIILKLSTSGGNFFGKRVSRSSRTADTKWLLSVLKL